MTFNKTPPPNAASAPTSAKLSAFLNTLGKQSGVHKPLAFRMLAAVKCDSFFMKVLLVNIKLIAVPS